MRRKSVPSREDSKSKGTEAGQDLVCLKSIMKVNIMKVNLTELEIWMQRGVVRD